MSTGHGRKCYFLFQTKLQLLFNILIHVEGLLIQRSYLILCSYKKELVKLRAARKEGFPKS